MPHWWRSFRTKKRPIVKCKRRGVLCFFNAFNVSHFFFPPLDRAQLWKEVQSQVSKVIRPPQRLRANGLNPLCLKGSKPFPSPFFFFFNCAILHRCGGKENEKGTFCCIFSRFWRKKWSKFELKKILKFITFPLGILEGVAYCGPGFSLLGEIPKITLWFSAEVVWLST